MFADSLLDSAYGNRSHRGWATLASFAAQALAVCTLLILPLLHPQGLPRLKLLSGLSPIVAPPSPPPKLQVHPATPSVSNLSADNRVTMSSVVPPKPTVTHRPLLSHMMEGNLIYRVEPRYPPLAIQARIQGDVVLQAMISRSGMIENLQLVSGHPMLVRAAMDAVRQWRYRPYILNDEPIEVETQVTVKFVLNK